jgi:hypothetical protein
MGAWSGDWQGMVHMVIVVIMAGMVIVVIMVFIIIMK